jgi:hypothetical protein
VAVVDVVAVAAAAADVSVVGATVIVYDVVIVAVLQDNE